MSERSRFGLIGRAVPGQPGSGFVVVGPGSGPAEATAFLAWLAGHGRGSIRSGRIHWGWRTS
jgi:hypothetical protein